MVLLSKNRSAGEDLTFFDFCKPQKGIPCAQDIIVFA